ncbi:MAG: hypothetical protein WC317_07270 [Candidatus Omnitrophota bacterium]|jgi:hypothetical protein
MQKIGQNTMKKIKWNLTLFAYLALIGVIVLTVFPLLGFPRIWGWEGIGGWEGLNLSQSFWLLLASIILAFLAIYPKSQYDFWLQRFLAGLTLFILPVLFINLALRYFLIIIIVCDIILIITCAILFYLCININNKTNNSYNSKLDSLLKASFSLSFIMSLSGLLLFRFQVFPLFSLLVFPFMSLLIGIPALISGRRVAKIWLFLAYIGIIISQGLLLVFYMAVCNSYVGE